MVRERGVLRLKKNGAAGRSHSFTTVSAFSLRLLSLPPTHPLSPSATMSNGHILHPVSGPKESVGGLLDNNIYPSRFLNLDQVREERERKSPSGPCVRLFWVEEKACRCHPLAPGA